jgi:tetratricopeptide (TPR) repeat protein
MLLRAIAALITLVATFGCTQDSGDPEPVPSSKGPPSKDASVPPPWLKTLRDTPPKPQDTFTQNNPTPTVATALVRPPWALDDGNSESFFDQAMRDKIQKAVVNIKAGKGMQGLKEGSDPFKIKLATGLFYFVDTSAQPGFLRIGKKIIQERTAELREMGLGDFQKELLQTGGFGFSDLRGKDPNQIVMTALDAIGDTTITPGDFTAAHILFGVFELAGLQPSFYSVPMKFTHPHLDEVLLRGFVPLRRNRQFIVGIPLEKSVRYFNLLTLSSDAGYPQREAPDNVAQFSPEQYLPLYLGARAHQTMLQSQNYEQALEDLNLAISLNPKGAHLRNSLGLALLQQGKKEQAEQSFKKALELDSAYAEAVYQLGDLYFEKGKWEKGMELIQKAVSENSDAVIPVYGPNILRRIHATLAKDPINWDAVKTAEKLTEYQRAHPGQRILPATL